MQCYTGMAFADLIAFDRKDVKIINGQYFISKQRQKSKQYLTYLFRKKLLKYWKNTNGKFRFTQTKK